MQRYTTYYVSINTFFLNRFINILIELNVRYKLSKDFGQIYLTNSRVKLFVYLPNIVGAAWLKGQCDIGPAYIHFIRIIKLPKHVSFD